MKMDREIAVPLAWYQGAAFVTATTISKNYFPRTNAHARVYTCEVKQFLTPQAFLVRFVNSQRTQIIPYDHPDAHRISITDFAANPAFAASVLSGHWTETAGPVDQAELIVQHCEGCGNRLVIDGVHRIVSIARTGNTAQLTCLEISGSDWPPETPDMNRACACLAP